MQDRELGVTSIRASDLDVIREIYESRQWGRYYTAEGQFRDGFAVRLERLLAEWSGRQYAITCGSGTEALSVALRAVGVRGGDVLLPGYSFAACGMAVCACGARPLAAATRDDLLPDLDALRPVASERTTACLAVHMRGIPQPMHEWRRMADDLGVPLVEDSSQWDGMQIDGRWPVSRESDIAVISFQAKKAISVGEGGVLLTDDPALYQRIVQQIDSAWYMRPAYRSWSDHGVPGVAARMTEVVAGLLCLQVERLPSVLARRRKVDSKLRQALACLAPAGFHLAGPEDIGTTIGVRLPSGRPAGQVTSRLLQRDVVLFPESGGNTDPHTVHGWPMSLKTRMADASAGLTRALTAWILLPTAQPSGRERLVDALRDVVFSA